MEIIPLIQWQCMLLCAIKLRSTLYLWLSQSGFNTHFLCTDWWSPVVGDLHPHGSTHGKLHPCQIVGLTAMSPPSRSPMVMCLSNLVLGNTK